METRSSALQRWQVGKGEAGEGGLPDRKGRRAGCGRRRSWGRDRLSRAGDTRRSPILADERVAGWACRAWSSATPLTCLPLAVSRADSTSACSSVLTFDLSTAQPHQLSRARLWLHARPAPPGSLYLRVFGRRPGGGQRGARTLLAEQHLPAAGWHALALPSGGLRAEESAVLQLQLKCRLLPGNRTSAQQLGRRLLDTAGDRRPFLQLQIWPREPGAGRARRRTPTCEPETPLCCRRDHYVDFQELGWRDWILQPEGYQLNYCSGQCPPHLAGSPGIAASFHSAVFSLLKANNPWPLGTSCCVPTARRPLSLLYLDRDGNVVKTDVPDMVVEACGCS